MLARAWPALCLLLAIFSAGCAERECPALHDFNEVAERCLHEWMPAHYVIHLHHMDASYQANESAMVVTIHATNLLDELVIFTGLSVTLGDEWGGMGRAKRELEGTDLVQLGPFETRQFAITVRNPIFNSDDGKISVHAEFEDVRNRIENRGGLAMSLYNTCVLLRDGKIEPGQGRGRDRCEADELTSDHNRGDYNRASIHLRVYNFEGDVEAYLPGPHNVEFWYRYCARCYDGFPPEKFGPVG